MKNELKSKSGYVFARADKSAVYGTLMYLGKNDSTDNYIQIPIKEAEKLKEKIKADMLARIETRKKESNQTKVE